jgi:hypothetical protein
MPEVEHKFPLQVIQAAEGNPQRGQVQGQILELAPVEQAFHAHVGNQIVGIMAASRYDRS